MGQPQVNRSVGVARHQQTSGDAFVLVSSDPSVDISPMRALTLALLELERGLKTQKKRSGRAAFY